MKTLKMLVMVLVLLVVGGEVFGSLVISNPDQLLGTSHVQDIEMLDGDRLMERNFDVVPSVDSIVDKGSGEYYIFFWKNVPGGIVLGAYVDTDNATNNAWSGYDAWCSGYIDRNVFTGDNDSPDDVFAIYDPDGGQFALLDPGVLRFDTNLTFWGNDAIEYGGVIGGLADINFGSIVATPVCLDSVVLVPEPATIALLGFGCLMLRRKK